MLKYLEVECWGCWVIVELICFLWYCDIYDKKKKIYMGVGIIEIIFFFYVNIGDIWRKWFILGLSDLDLK